MVNDSSRARRRLAGLAAAAALSLLASACGSDDSSAGSSDTTAAPADTSATTAAPAGTAPAFPVTVEHALGTTIVESEPQRIVTVGVTEQDFVLALGLTPIGVSDWYGDQPFATWPWAQDELGDAEPAVLSIADGFEYERIAALEPDLIVGTNAGIDAESFEKLTAIAPTIAHPAGSALYFSPGTTSSG